MSPAGTPVWNTGSGAPRVTLPREVDVLIVGAGITGISLVRRLARDGLTVAALERGRPGDGASGRNAGFLLTGVAANYASAARQFGRAQAAEIWDFTIENHRMVADALAGLDVGYRRGGSWVLPASAEEREQLLESVSLLREDGLAGEWREVAPASGGGPGGGLLNPSDGETDPGRAIAELAATLPAGTLVGEASVIGIEPSGGGVRVHCSQGEVRAGRVVVATNGYTSRLFPGLPVRAVRAQMLATGPLSRTIVDRPVYSDFGYRYWRQLADGRVLLGGFRNTDFDAEVGDDDAPTDSLQRRLDAHLVALGVTVPVTHRWAGTMGFTPDELPIVGAVPGQPNVFVCAGYSGHGLGFAMKCADVLAGSWQGAALPAWLDAARFAQPALPV